MKTNKIKPYQLLARLEKVINSCRTLEQLKIATNYKKIIFNLIYGNDDIFDMHRKNAFLYHCRSHIITLLYETNIKLTTK